MRKKKGRRGKFGRGELEGEAEVGKEKKPKMKTWKIFSLFFAGQSDSQVVVLPIIDTLFPRPEFLPPAIPKDLAPRLIRLHSQPLAWWIGQMLRYLMRPQPSTEKFFNESINKLNFKKPIVG